MILMCERFRLVDVFDDLEVETIAVVRSSSSSPPMS
jgi:hypothetical protein